MSARVRAARLLRAYANAEPVLVELLEALNDFYKESPIHGARHLTVERALEEIRYKRPILEGACRKRGIS